MREMSRVQVSFVVIGPCAAAVHAVSSAIAATLLLRCTARLRGILRSTEYIGGVRLDVDGYIEESDHHLFPTLIAVADFRRGIGIVLVVGRVVKCPCRFDAGAGRQNLPLRELIP